MASTKAIAGSAQTHGLLTNIVTAKGKFRNSSEWAAAEVGALPISLPNLVNVLPADQKLVVKIDIRALAKLFMERDDRDPGCLSVRNVSSPLRIVVYTCIANGFGNRWVHHIPEFVIMVHGVPAVAVNNPCNVYFKRQQNRIVDERICYFPGANGGAVDPVNVTQLIILAQAQAKALKEGTISNNYPLAVATHWVSADGRTIQAYYAKVSKEYLDGLLTPEKSLTDSLTVYRHAFEINEHHIANDGPDNGFANAMRCVVALLSAIEVVPESDVVEHRDIEYAGNPNSRVG